MNLKQKIELLKYLSDLIHRKATGTPQQLARKLNMSSASARRYLKTLREDLMRLLPIAIIGRVIIIQKPMNWSYDSPI